MLAAVPRVFEKMYARIVEQGSKTTGLKRKLFDWAMKVAKRAATWRCGEAGASAAEAAMGAGGQVGVFEDQRGHRRAIAHCFFRRRAALEGSRGIFLVDRAFRFIKAMV